LSPWTIADFESLPQVFTDVKQLKGTISRRAANGRPAASLKFVSKEAGISISFRVGSWFDRTYVQTWRTAAGAAEVRSSASGDSKLTEPQPAATGKKPGKGAPPASIAYSKKLFDEGCELHFFPSELGVKSGDLIGRIESILLEFNIHREDIAHRKP